MSALLESIKALGASTEWLITANLILCVLLGQWMLRYRSLYRVSAEAQKNGADLIENLSEGIYRAAPDGRQLTANKALVRMNGYTSEAEMLEAILGNDSDWYVEPNRRDLFREILHRDGHVEDFVSECYRHRTRERFWVSESARVVYDKGSGRELYYEGSVRDVTETVEKLALEQQFRKLTKRLPVGLFHFVRHADGTYRTLLNTEGAAKVSGIPIQEQMADPGIFATLILPDDLPRFYETLRRSGETLEPWDCQFRILARDGVEKWVRINALVEAINGETNWYGYISDVSVRKRQEMEIEELAFYDPLTHLPNRRMLLDRMAQAIGRCAEGSLYSALLFIDLDNFKSLNDTLGHGMGDRFLVRVAERLRGCVAEADVVARIGGDEFVVVLDPGASAAEIARSAITAANRILAELARGFDLEDRRHVGSASIGVVQFGSEAKGSEELLRKADLAMYQAKSAGRNGVALFDPAIMDMESERLETLTRLRDAFDRRELVLHFQPQVDHAGKVRGAEALVRWDRPAHGLVMPGDFVPVAEQNGLNDALTRFVFESGVDTLVGWSRKPATRHLRLSLNVGVEAFAGDSFVPMVRRLVADRDFDPSRLTVELTEHVMARDPAHVALRMAELKTLGIGLSLDDFGTGYSSLAYLKRLPFDEVKIDGGFVTDIETSESDRALVKTILAMARTLGLKTVAEHVENMRQEAFLRAFGCDVLQGHLYSRALPAEDFLRLFAGTTEPAALRLTA